LNKVEIHKGAAWFICPGCGQRHRVPFSPEAWEGQHESGNRPMWTFNGDTQRPTFSPSLLCRWMEGENFIKKVCHSFIRDGKIEFLGDCTHVLAGKTVELSDIKPKEKGTA
jgi:hypothetical protein